MFFLFLLQVILVPWAVATDDTSCGQIGLPDGLELITNKSNTFTYQCLSKFILEGDRERKCVNGQFTGSVPLCRPFFEASDLSNLKGKGHELINCENRIMKAYCDINFDTTFISVLYVWTNQMCKQLKVITNEGTYEKSTSSPGHFNTTLHTFSVNNSVSHIKIERGSKSCGLYSLSLPNYSIGTRCGTPDLPNGVMFQRFPSMSGKFSCDSSHKLEGESNTHCIGLEKWSNANVKCVNDNVKLIIIVVGSLVALALLIAAFCLFIWFLNKSETCKYTKIPQ